ASEPLVTGIGGSSLGGLLSLYLGLKHPHVFGKIAALSPSVWWHNRMITQFASTWPTGVVTLPGTPSTGRRRTLPVGAQPRPEQGRRNAAPHLGKIAPSPQATSLGAAPFYPELRRVGFQKGADFPQLRPGATVRSSVPLGGSSEDQFAGVAPLRP